MLLAFQLEGTKLFNSSVARMSLYWSMISNPLIARFRLFTVEYILDINLLYLKASWVTTVFKEFSLLTGLSLLMSSKEYSWGSSCS